MFASAKQAEVIRSNQKDEYYAGYIKSSLADIVQSCFGPRAWIKWRRELDLMADLGYFALTTFAGLQSLGEEYVNVLLVDETKRYVPSRWKRGFMVGLQVAAPYLIDRSLSMVERHLQRNPDLNLSPEARTKLLQILPVLRHVVTILHRCHLAAFYMRGVFYHIAKRLTGIHYILVRDRGSGMDSGGSNYRILGWLAVIQLSFTFGQQLQKWLRSKRWRGETTPQTPEVKLDYMMAKKTSTTIDDTPLDPSRKCSLCLEERKHSTATPCGHMFCWSCIMEWCSSKTECPLCREPFEMSRLIFLKNYDPV